jgi:hypothetical protein
MIVLDEQLQGLGLEAALKRWYRGRVCFITDLRPGIVIKDEMIPRLLRTVSEATFVTVNVRHFWERTEPDDAYGLVCLTLPTNRAAEVSSWLRRLFQLPPFRTKRARMGKVARISDEQVEYYEVHGSRSVLLSLP